MPFVWHPPALPGAPPAWDDSGYVSAPQAHAIYGRFGDPNATRHAMTGPPVQTIGNQLPAAGITGMASDGMSACSGVFLRCATAGGVIGIAIHYDGGGDVAAMFNKLLGYYHLDNAHGRAISQTFLAKHHAMDQTAYGAYQSLIGAGFNEPTQRSHNGAACIDQAGNFFNQYL